MNGRCFLFFSALLQCCCRPSACPFRYTSIWESKSYLKSKSAMENEVQGSKKCVAFLRQSRNQAPRRCVWNDATALLWKNRSSFAINEGADSFSSIARGRSALRPFCNATQIFNCELFSWETKSESQKIRKQKQKEENNKRIPNADSNEIDFVVERFLERHP